MSDVTAFPDGQEPEFGQPELDSFSYREDTSFGFAYPPTDPKRFIDGGQRATGLDRWAALASASGPEGAESSLPGNRNRVRTPPSSQASHSRGENDR